MKRIKVYAIRLINPSSGKPCYCTLETSLYSDRLTTFSKSEAKARAKIMRIKCPNVEYTVVTFKEKRI